jgi:hypothetical protein
MTADTLWRRYSSIWSEPDAARRADELAVCLADNASYCDPNGLIEGRAALSEYMAGFQQTVPGGTFRLNGLRQHNDRTLANWSMLGPDGKVLQDGVSFAQLSVDGRLQAISGFFELPG